MSLSYGVLIVCLPGNTTDNRKCQKTNLKECHFCFQAGKVVGILEKFHELFSINTNVEVGIMSLCTCSGFEFGVSLMFFIGKGIELIRSFSPNTSKEH